MSRKGPDVQVQVHAPWSLTKGRWSHLDVPAATDVDDELIEIHVRLGWKALVGVMVLILNAFYVLIDVVLSNTS